MQKKRPLSPHLQIYRLPLAALLSIGHRLTGLALIVGSLGFVGWLAALASGPEAFASLQACMTDCPWILLSVMAFSLALYYHLLNGIRHLFWDWGFGYSLATVRISNMIVLGLTFLLTALTWWEKIP